MPSEWFEYINLSDAKWEMFFPDPTPFVVAMLVCLLDWRMGEDAPQRILVIHDFEISKLSEAFLKKCAGVIAEL